VRPVLTPSHADNGTPGRRQIAALQPVANLRTSEASAAVHG